jgi:Reverse transcriptase (RNA-dependent DNA polymerase)
VEVNFQVPGRDYMEIYAPTVCKESLRTLIGLMALRRMKSIQMDVKNAFLHGPIDKKELIELPKTIFTHDFCTQHVGVLQKAL